MAASERGWSRERTRQEGTGSIKRHKVCVHREKIGLVGIVEIFCIWWLVMARVLALGH